MTALVTDELGPRGRARVRYATIASLAVLAVLLGLAVYQFAQSGELDPEKWAEIAQPAVFQLLLRGLSLTVRLAATSMVFAIVIGFALALGRLSRWQPVRLVAGAYVEFFRAMPVLLLILFSRFGLPDLGLTFSDFTYVVLALVAYNSATLGEIFRAGILSLDRGQSEAAYAVGLTYRQAMSSVILPQAVRRMTPAIVSQLVTLTKDTTLAYILGTLAETLIWAERIGARLRNELQMYIVAAVIFFLICYALSRLASWLEQRQRRTLGAGAVAVAADEDVTLTEEQR